MSDAADTLDNADDGQKRKAGRPKGSKKTAKANLKEGGTVDLINPMQAKQAELAKEARERSSKNPVVKKWYRLHGPKLILCKQKKNGSVYTTFVGSINDKASGAGVKEFVDQLQKEKRLEVKV